MPKALSLITRTPRPSGNRVSQTASTPSVLLVSDTFTDTNTTNLTAHTIAPTNTIEAAWSSLVGEMKISSNMVAAFAASVNRTNVYAVDGLSAVRYFESDLRYDSDSNRTVGIVVRATDASNYWELYLYVNSFGLIERAGGSNTARTSVNLTLANGATYTVRGYCLGDYIIAQLLSSGAVIASLEYESTQFNDKTKYGLYAFTTAAFSPGNVAMDNFKLRSVDTSDIVFVKPRSGVTNPVLTAAHVTDVTDGLYVADPFIVNNGGTYYMFYEIKQNAGPTFLCYSTSSDGLTWTYGSKLAGFETISLPSYPYVFRVGSTWYMIPDIYNNDNLDKSIDLYQATAFPATWAKVKTLLANNNPIDDHIIFKWGENWYLFVGDRTGQTLRLFVADDLLTGTFTEHPSSPVLSGLRNYRPGGRAILRSEAIDIFVQDNVVRYGHQVRTYRISALSPTEITIAEQPISPVITASGSGWNSDGMHQIDQYSSGLTIVDGFDSGGTFGIGIYSDAA